VTGKSFLDRVLALVTGVLLVSGFCPGLQLKASLEMVLNLKH